MTIHSSGYLSADMSVSCSIIIPHYNQVAHLKRCLEHLSCQEHVDNAEIVVVDNESDEQAIEVIRTEHPEIRFIVSAANHNPYTMRNEGIKVANGAYIAFLDAKCLPRPDWLATLTQAMAEHDIVGGRYDIRYPSSELKDKVYGLLYLNNNKNVREGYGLSAGNLMVRKSLFDQFGGFDDQHYSGSDILWTRRAGDNSARIGYSDKSIVDYQGQSWEELQSKVIKYGHGAAIQGQRASWRSYMPLGLGTFREALEYRGLTGLSSSDKTKLYYYTSLMKWRYSRALSGSM